MDRNTPLVNELAKLDTAKARSAAARLIRVGLRDEPHTDPHALAHDVAQALGLVPTVTANPAGYRGESGAACLRRLKAAAAAKAGQR